jgi:hypothetical protein
VFGPPKLNSAASSEPVRTGSELPNFISQSLNTTFRLSISTKTHHCPVDLSRIESWQSEIVSAQPAFVDLRVLISVATNDLSFVITRSETSGSDPDGIKLVPAAVPLCLNLFTSNALRRCGVLQRNDAARCISIDRSPVSDLRRRMSVIGLTRWLSRISSKKAVVVRR